MLDPHCYSVLTFLDSQADLARAEIAAVSMALAHLIAARQADNTPRTGPAAAGTPAP